MNSRPAETGTIGASAGDGGRTGFISRGKGIADRVTANPVVAHLLRANARFLQRLGTQFASAITYFSFLAIIPLLMVGFSITGFILASRPDVMQQIQDSVKSQVPGMESVIGPLIDTAVGQRLAVGIIGLVIALYSGAGWAGNIRKAIQAQTKPDFADVKRQSGGLVKYWIRNVGALVGLGLAMLASFAITGIGSAAQHVVLSSIGLQDAAWAQPVIRVVTILLAVLANLLIFIWIYSMMPAWVDPPPKWTILKAAFLAALAMEILKQALAILLPKVTGSPTAAIFGPIIGLLFFFNLVATVILWIAAWAATAREPAPDEEPVPPVPPAVLVTEADIGVPRVVLLMGVGAVTGWLAGHLRRR